MESFNNIIQNSINIGDSTIYVGDLEVSEETIVTLKASRFSSSKSLDIIYISVTSHESFHIGNIIEYPEYDIKIPKDSIQIETSTREKSNIECSIYKEDKWKNDYCSLSSANSVKAVYSIEKNGYYTLMPEENQYSSMIPLYICTLLIALSLIFIPVFMYFDKSATI